MLKIVGESNLIVFELIVRHSKIRRGLLQHWGLARKYLLGHSSLLEGQVAGAVELTVVREHWQRHAGEVNAVLGGKARVLQLVHPIPPLSPRVRVGYHVVVELEVRQVLVGGRHRVRVHLSQQVRISFVHPWHERCPRLGETVHVILLHQVRRSYAVLPSRFVLPRDQARGTRAAYLCTVEMAVVVVGPRSSEAVLLRYGFA